MEALATILFILAFLGGIVGLMFLMFSILEGEPELLFITLIGAVVAVGCGFGASAAQNSYDSNWHAGDAIVRTVFTEDGNTMVLDNKGNVYHCVTASECSKLTKGDHVTFERLPKGSAVKDTADVRGVTKG